MIRVQGQGKKVLGKSLYEIIKDNRIDNIKGFDLKVDKEKGNKDKAKN